MVIQTPKSRKPVAFGNLCPGDVFMEPATSEILMVVGNPYADWNVVNLKSGEIMAYGSDVLVLRVSAVLRVEG